MLDTMKHQAVLIKIEIEKYSNEVKEDKEKKLAKLNRFIELIDNLLKANYFERVGGKNEYNKNFIKEADILEEDEWNEIIDILKDEMRDWWN